MCVDFDGSFMLPEVCWRLRPETLIEPFVGEDWFYPVEYPVSPKFRGFFVDRKDST
jgi:hypothetical protein